MKSLLDRIFRLRLWILALVSCWICVAITPVLASQPPPMLDSSASVAQQQPKTLPAAQMLNTQGNLQLTAGEARNAYATFRQAERIYQDLGDRTGVILSRLNQTQALQALGFYRRAEASLLDLQQELKLRQSEMLLSEPAQLIQARLEAEIWLNLGQVWQTLGDLAEAQSALERSAAGFEQLMAKDRLASVLLSQGEIARERQQLDQAKLLYAEALSQARQALAQQNMSEDISSGISGGTLGGLTGGEAGANGMADAVTDALQQVIVQAQLHQLRLLVHGEIHSEDSTEARRLGDELLKQLSSTPTYYWQIEARINLAESLRLMHDLDTALSLLDVTLPQVEKLDDLRAISYVLGQQGRIYEAQGRWTEALDVTRQARQQSMALGADEITVHWLWQEGRLLRQTDSDAAIATYNEAIQLLQTLRQDLVAVNSEARFSFRDQVESVYRQQVELLLQGVDALPAAVKQQRLEQARQTIEALQLAQVQNFSQEACDTYDVQPIEQIDPQAAVFYPIVLGDRIEVVLALPGLPLQHYGSALSQADRQKMLAQLRQSLNPAFAIGTGLPAAQQFYDQLIRPAEAWLEQQDIQTLVFVLDDFLRNVPMAVLHDGDRYLVQKYSLALTPGLQLFDSKPLAQERLQVLAAGLSQARQGFAPLPGVEQELQSIVQFRSGEQSASIGAEILLDQDFTEQQLVRQARRRPFNVLHLATHGQFSSKASETFLLTWNDRLGIGELEQSLNPRLGSTTAGRPRSPIEMLILSACQTAKGDRRAALGLAGLAVRSGARSTLATLWSVQDQSTARLVNIFYQQLLQQGASRSEALRQAQLSLLEGDYAHPYYWAPFVLVGNWQ